MPEIWRARRLPQGDPTRTDPRRTLRCCRARSERERRGPASRTARLLRAATGIRAVIIHVVRRNRIVPAAGVVPQDKDCGGVPVLRFSHRVDDRRDPRRTRFRPEPPWSEFDSRRYPRHCAEFAVGHVEENCDEGEITSLSQSGPSTHILDRLVPLPMPAFPPEWSGPVPPAISSTLRLRGRRVVRPRDACAVEFLSERVRTPSRPLRCPPETYSYQGSDRVNATARTAQPPSGYSNKLFCSLPAIRY